MAKREDYIIDKNGRKKAVILDIVEYEELLEDIESLALIADTKDEPKRSFEEIKTRLRASGRL
ncbi:MAG: type II toxin-antitoxin system Phd/YefM family antitoxin [Proteobacteria bacterium]|nr:type II toxin-antitoxin system Phd/YefM family antitoxin [Pseudomonadota bacterium]